MNFRIFSLLTCFFISIFSFNEAVECSTQVKEKSFFAGIDFCYFTSSVEKEFYDLKFWSAISPGGSVVNNEDDLPFAICPYFGLELFSFQEYSQDCFIAVEFGYKWLGKVRRETVFNLEYYDIVFQNHKASKEYNSSVIDCLLSLHYLSCCHLDYFIKIGVAFISTKTKGRNFVFYDENEAVLHTTPLENRNYTEWVPEWSLGVGYDFFERIKLNVYYTRVGGNRNSAHRNETGGSFLSDRVPAYSLVGFGLVSEF